MARGPRFARPPRCPVIKLEKEPCAASICFCKTQGRQREATITEPEATTQGPAGGKSNGRQREATITEPKATTQGPAEGESSGKQREAMGGNDNGAEVADTETNSLRNQKF